MSFSLQDALVAVQADCHPELVAKLDVGQAIDNVTSSIALSETAEDKFYEHEITLAALLLWRFQNLVEGVGAVGQLLEAAATNQRQDIFATLTSLQVDLRAVVENADRRTAVLGILTGSAVVGAEILNLATSVADSNIARALLGAIEGQTSYFANYYYARIVEPQLRAAVEAQLNGAEDEDFTGALQALATKLLLGSGAYWRMVANGSVGRAHHYGILKASQDRGAYAYRLRAVLDRRTSKVCRALNGSTFYTHQGLNLLETLAYTAPEAIGNVAPWPTITQANELTSDELAGLGMSVPPFHPHCRTTIVPIYS